VPEDRDLTREIEKAEAQLAELERARDQAAVHVTRLRRAHLAASESPQLRLPTVPAASPPRSGTEKIRLFRSLFKGRTDVFPKRWENAKQGRSGYAPVCANEWLRGVCEKAKVKCGECPHQAYPARAKKSLMGPADPTRRLAGAADLLALPANRAAEVIAGDIVDKAAPSFSHGNAQSGLSGALFGFRGSSGGPGHPKRLRPLGAVTYFDGRLSW